VSSTGNSTSRTRANDDAVENSAEHIGHLANSLRPPLLRVTRLMRTQRVDTSVTLAELSVMNLLRQGPKSIGELAVAERTQPPTMTRLVAALERRQLLERGSHPVDKRRAMMTLTPKALELLDSETRARDAWLCRRMGTLRPEQLRVLADVIPVLIQLADDVDDE
jgi:DNA-binding MarR family transcriptional regulator